jgi:hypothetical protein
MFNTLWELTGGVGTSQAATNAATGEHANDDGVIFDEEVAGVDFKNQLQAVPMGATITQPQGADADVLTLPLPPPPPQQQQMGVGVIGVGGAKHQQATAVYSGIDAALRTLGHTMYDLGAINAELKIQSGMNPADAESQLAFRDFAVNVQKFRVYLAMLGGQPSYVSMIHTPGVYYSINALTSAYQGRCWRSWAIVEQRWNPPQYAYRQQRRGSGIQVMLTLTLPSLRSIIQLTKTRALFGGRGQTMARWQRSRYQTFWQFQMLW